jgi:subtilisin family serine protease
MNGALPSAPRGITRRISPLIGLTLAPLLLGCSEGSPLDPFTSTGEPLAVDPATLPGGPTSEPVVTLITGDRVRLSRPPVGEPVVSIEPGPGREQVQFSVRISRNDGQEEIAVVPQDALPLLAAGRLDPQLFDVSLLIRQGFDDASQLTLPLIITYQGPPASALLAASGASSRRFLASIPGEAVLADKQNAGTLWGSITAGASGRAGLLPDGIDKVWLDARLPLLLDQSAGLIGAPAAWDAGLTGLGVTVAVLDTGVAADHPDLAGRILEAVDFTDTRPDASDNVGHGTHVAGTIAGSGAASDGRFRGIAPDASLVIGKVCSGNTCSTSAIVAGMEWAAPRARIVSMSLGGGGSDGTDPLSQSVNNLSAEHGTLFVAAAGNAGADQTVGSPAAADAALAVASTDKNGRLSGFSSRGPRRGDYALKPEIAAPGGGIIAARAQGTPGGDGAPVGDHYTRMSGTSMACPHVAGSAALLAQLHPDWKGPQLKAALMSSARPVADTTVTATGAGQVDLARAISQTVYAVDGRLDFGRLAWPHEAEAQRRIVTYQNDGDAPVTLDLQLTATAADGTAAPEGLFVVDPQVIVPAQGRATATVIMTPQPRRSGMYGVRLVASGGGQVVQTAGLLYQEPERYDLTIVGIDREGEAADGAFGFAYNPAAAVSTSINFAGGSATLRVDKGIYDVHTILYGSPVTIAASRPLIAVDGDTTVTLDARQARPLQVTAVDRPDAALIWSGITLHSKDLTGRTGVSTLTLSSTPVYVLPTQPVTDHAFNVNWRAYLSTPGPAAGIDPAAPYIYNLVFPIHGGIPEDPHFKVRDQDLGIVHARYHKQGEATAYRSNIGSTGDNASSYTPIWVQPLPGQRLEYYTAGIQWDEALQIYPLTNPGLFYSERTLGSGVYQAGQHHFVRWNSAPIGPAFGPAGTLWGAYRIGNDISIYLTPFSPGEPQHTTAYFRGTTRILRDGVLIGSSTSGAYGRFAVPAEAGTYTVEATGDRQVSWASVGTAFSGSWTFSSAGANDGNLRRLPLMLVHVSGPVNLENSAPAGLPFLLELEVKRQPGSAAPALTELGLDVSFDDGATWKAAEVFASDERRFALVAHPATPGFVSLRCQARDAAGNSVTHSMLRAYRTH